MVATDQHLFQTIVQFDKTVFPRKLATGSIHDYFFATAPYMPLVGILFKVLRMMSINCEL